MNKILLVALLLALTACKVETTQPAPNINGHRLYEGTNTDYPVVCIDGLLYMWVGHSASIKFDKTTMQPELCVK